jgi:Iap family predicted aminopeptidase
VCVHCSCNNNAQHTGFVEENKLKDAVTARISADSSVFAAESVAASIVQGLANGTFMITTGLDGWLISQGTAGFAPAQSALQALANVLLAGILRAASFAYLFRYTVKLNVTRHRAYIMKCHLVNVLLVSVLSVRATVH